VINISKPTEIDDSYDSKLGAVIDKLKELIISPSDVAQIRACRAITSLNQAANIPYLVTCGLVADLIDLLSSNYESVQEQAIIALISLSEVDEGSNAIREQRGIPPLIALLQSSNAALLLVSTKLLTKLAKNDHNKEAIRDSSGIQPLIDLLKLPNEFVQIQTVWAISCLLEDGEHLPIEPKNLELAQDDFLNSGGLSPLLKLLLSTNPGLQMRVLTALGCLITNGNSIDTMSCNF
jgi:hypothetical protein